jgi:hypothetical protein
MKRTSFLLSVLFFFTAASAQINKGSVLLGGSLFAGSQTLEGNNSSNKSNGFSFSPSIAVLVRNNLAVGINAGFGKYTTKDTSLNNETNSFNAGAFVRRYIPLGKSFYLTGDLSLGFGRSKQEQVIGPAQSYGTKQTSVNLNLYPGIAYAVSKHFHLEASLNGIANIGFSKTESTSTSFGVSARSTIKGFNFSSNASNSIPLNIGFRFLIGK